MKDLYFLLASLPGRAAGEKGQSMVEYTLITFFLLIAAGGVAFAFLPDMLSAYQDYIDSFSFVLNLPIP
ncbi:MAG: hypothetical protein GXP49_12650 [Deltaproteobacteria bacterium]|nr:hypothetical protein [Deltaproteobacteria bacterium]